MTKSHYRVTVYLYRYPHLVFIIFLLLPLQTPITRMKFTYKLRTSVRLEVTGISQGTLLPLTLKTTILFIIFWNFKIF